MDRVNRITAFLCCTLMLGCAASEPETSPREPRQKNTSTAPLTVYERDFMPSHFDVAIAQVESSSQRYTAREQDTITTATNTTTELTPGFRVQVMFSNSINEATKVKNEVALLFSADIVYVLYDSPYYKVRVGDYQERNDATQALKILIDKGYMQSWIVPDRVQKNPLKSPPPPMK
jgi:hypothetical protein